MMEQSQDNKADSVDGVTEQQGESAVCSVGCQLRAARERMGLSVEDVVGKIKLAARQIIALEADDFQALPETAFVRGFVRSYAKLLQLDVQPLLDALPGTQPVQATVEKFQIEAPLPSERTVRQQNINLLVASFVIALGIAGFAVWQANTPDEVPAMQETQGTGDAMIATPLPLPEQAEMLDGSGVPEVAVSGVLTTSAVAVAPVPASAVMSVMAMASLAPTAALRLVFDKEAWAEIKDKSGKTLSNQLNHAGTELRVEGIAPFTMVVGHATSVHLYVREKSVDLGSYTNAYSDVARLTVE